ncbi:MAG: hypothetical protein ACYS71_03915, partial [Planctomycetota bacterium]
MQKTWGYQLYACGKSRLPKEIFLNQGKYRLVKVLKHDFFAATMLYEHHGRPQETKQSGPARIVLKISRTEHFLGLPLLWLGEGLCSHEVSILRRLSNLHCVPQVLSRYGKTGFIYEYIEGSSLDEAKDVSEDFFDRCVEMLRQIHQRDIVYLDMNKRSNILIGPGARPHLIDFQISFHIDRHMLIWPRFAEYLKNALQKADLYHLLKHKRRFHPHVLKPQERAISRQRSGLIKTHRLTVTPLRKLRRALLKHLHKKGMIITE